MKNILKTFDRTINAIGKKLIDGFRNELEVQNSIATGKLADSMFYDLDETADSIELVIQTRAKYVDIVDKGMKAGNMPSLTAIKNWMDAKGIKHSNENEKESIAYAIAKRIRAEDLPTQGGKRLSSTKEKTNFIGNVVNRRSKKNDNSIHSSIGKDINNIFKQLPKQI